MFERERVREKVRMTVNTIQEVEQKEKKKMGDKRERIATNKKELALNQI